LPMTMKSVELRLPAEPTAPAEARAVVEAIGSDLPEAVLVDAKLLLTELVANAVKYAILVRCSTRTRDHLAPGQGAAGDCFLWTRLPTPGAWSLTRLVRKSGSNCG
jgi:two-component sensor histidine kinase